MAGIENDGSSMRHGGNMESYDEQAAALVPFFPRPSGQRARRGRSGHRHAAAYNGAFVELARVTETSYALAPEEMLEAFFDVIALALGLETAVVIENVAGLPRSMTWTMPHLELQGRDVAENRAWSTLAGQVAPDLVEHSREADGGGHVTLLPLAPPLLGIVRCKTMQPLDRPHKSLLECAITHLSVALHSIRFPR
jgi:hypothetical protein